MRMIFSDDDFWWWGCFLVVCHCLGKKVKQICPNWYSGKGKNRKFKMAFAIRRRPPPLNGTRFLQKNLHTINVFLNDKKNQSAQNISPKVALTRLAAGGTTSCRWWLRCPGGALGDTRHRRSPVPVTWTPPHLLLVFLLLLLLFLFFYPIFLPPYRISHGPFIFSFAILPF